MNQKKFKLSPETEEEIKKYYSDFNGNHEDWFKNETDIDFLLLDDDPYKSLKEEDERNLIEAYSRGINFTNLPEFPEMKNGDYEFIPPEEEQEVEIDDTTYFGEAEHGMGKPLTF
jgi:hypothetical protein